MAAFSGEDSNKTWQRVAVALAGADPAAAKVFRQLKAQLSQISGDPQLQFLAFTGAQSVAAGGTVLATGVAKLVGFYVKKNGTTGTGNATDANIKFLDDATDDTGTADVVASAVLLVAADERYQIDAVGIPLAAGLVVTGHTTGVGATDSGASDGGSGFALVRI